MWWGFSCGWVWQCIISWFTWTPPKKSVEVTTEIAGDIHQSMQQWANELVKSLDSLLGDKFATMELEALCNLLEDIAMLAANIHHTELLQETLAVMKVMMLGDYGSLQGLCKRQEFVRMHTLLTAMCGPVTVGKSQV